METNEATRVLDKFIVGPVPTLIYVPNFISDVEEEQLVKNIYGAPVSKWKSLQNRRLQNWGGVVHEKGLIAQDLPHWLTRITRRVQDESGGLFPSAINHVLINEYLPDQGIMPHQDGPAYYPLVSILSLGSPVVMDFDPHPNLKRSTDTASPSSSFSVLLSPRSLLIFMDKAYSEYLHSIKDSAVHQCSTAVNVTKNGARDGDGPLGNYRQQAGGGEGDTGDTVVIRRTNTRLSLTCRLVTKVHKNLLRL
ncbi:unnamed protein product [Cuscuta campestris]|uniref:Alpha-ketoglutarate-dependent dioxygenase AlkB-like domain-containing protein n=1 Tax=Cuscuta campestris TaxID=132261 RepID=A0A484KBT0_9ASTE|nr:unnamed protein product [Cuscuta campestris]